MNDDQNLHAGHYDDRVHELFAQIADDPAPPLGFTADGIAGLGRRGARTRRVAAVGGATAGVAAIGIAIASLPGAVGSGRTATATSTSTSLKSSTPAATSSSKPADPVCEADVAKAFPDSVNRPERKLALQACPALRAIDTIFDPTGKHLVEVNGQLEAITPDIVWGEMGGKEGVSGTMANLCYNNEGKASTKNQGMCAELPEVAIQVTFSLPGAADPIPQFSDMTLADRKPGVGGGSAAWTEKSSTTIQDGSKVTVSEIQNGDRVALKARRVLPSGAALTIVAWDGYDSTSAVEQPGSVFNPFPFTLEQMAAAASVDQFVSPDALYDLTPLPSMTGSGPSPSPTTGR